VLEGGVVLEDEADVPVLDPGPGVVLPRDQDLTLIGLLQARDIPQERAA